MGYKELADFYYRLYMFDAEPNMPQTNHLKYIYDKAQGCPFEEIETLLFPMYSDVMDYDWSYELYLLMRIQGKNEYATAIKDDYLATYKNETNSVLIEELEQSDKRLEELFYSYSREAVCDDDPNQEELRLEEKILLEADELRMNPKEAEIQILFDDNDKVTLGAKLKLKKHLKEQEKLAKQAEKEGNVEEAEGNTQEIVEEAVSDENTDGNSAEEVEKNISENKVGIFKKLFSKKKSESAIDTDTTTSDVETDKIENDSQLTGVNHEEIIAEETATEETVIEESETEEAIAEEIEEEIAVEEAETEEAEIEEAEIEEAETEEAETEEAETEEAEIEEAAKNEYESEESIVVESEIDSYDFDFSFDNDESKVETEIVETEIVETEKVETDEAEAEVSNFESFADANEEIAEDADDIVNEHIDDMGDSVMREIYEKKKISIVTELGEDTFVNTQDLEFENESENPFSKLINQGKKEVEDESKTTFVYEEVQLEPEVEDEYEVDDFSKPIDLTDFDNPKQENDSADDGDWTNEINSVEYSPLSLDNEVEIADSTTENHVFEESIFGEETAEEVNAEKTVFEEPIFGEETVEEVVATEKTVFEEPIFGEEIVEEVVVAETVFEEPIFGEETVEEVVDAETVFEEPIFGEETVEEVVAEEAVFEETIFEEETVEEQMTEEVVVEDTVADEGVAGDSNIKETVVDDTVVQDLIGESVYDALKDKNTLDYPEFKSSLFPEVGQEVMEVNNNFNQIMNEAQDKINENLLKEEQMQREAEALLASLGIDLGSITATVPSSSVANTNVSNEKYNAETTNFVVQSQNDVQKGVEEKTHESNEFENVAHANEEKSTHNYSPSRDELKSSLKIDSVKKNILKQIKEYR